MIEIIGVKGVEEKAGKWRTLPKNVRQIGEYKEGRKIYIEDYVITYLNKMAKPDQAFARGAVLFGNVYETEEGKAVFISGAVEAGNLELDMDEIIFNDSIWSDFLEKGEQYFPGQDVIGWFLSRMGFSVDMNQKMLHLHKKNFPGEGKILYMIDSLDKEDAMYVYENNQMIRQKGYYIYYEKNSAMQDYMLEKEKGQSSEEIIAKGEIRRDKKIINNYRRISRYDRERKRKSLSIKGIRAACVLMIFVMGIGIAEKLGDHFVNMNASHYVVSTFQAVKEVFMPANYTVEEEVMEGELADTEGEIGPGELENKPGIQGDASGEGEEGKNGNISDKGKDMDEEMQETSAYSLPVYYVVKKGDTLAAISRKMYSTDKYTSRIARANDLLNEDEIYEGQKILIPSIE